MTRENRDRVKKLAEKVYRDPTTPHTTLVLARAVLMLIDGKLPS